MNALRQRLARTCAALALLATSGAGCDLLFPPPSQPESPTITSSDAALHAALFDPTLGCHDRLSNVSDLFACYDTDTALGEEARCALEPPLRELVFGCGREPEPIVPDPERVFAERLRLEIDPDHAPFVTARFQALYGPCTLAGEGPAVGQPPRWRADLGTRVCLAAPVETPQGRLVSSLRRYPGGAGGFPMGIFLELGPGLLDGEPLQPRAIVVETELLSPDERAIAIASFRALILEAGRSL